MRAVAAATDLPPFTHEKLGCCVQRMREAQHPHQRFVQRDREIE